MKIQQVYEQSIQRVKIKLIEITNDKQLSDAKRKEKFDKYEQCLKRYQKSLTDFNETQQRHKKEEQEAIKKQMKSKNINK